MEKLTNFKVLVNLLILLNNMNLLDILPKELLQVLFNYTYNREDLISLSKFQPLESIIANALCWKSKIINNFPKINIDFIPPINYTSKNIVSKIYSYDMLNKAYRLAHREVEKFVETLITRAIMFSDMKDSVYIDLEYYNDTVYWGITLTSFDILGINFDIIREIIDQTVEYDDIRHFIFGKNLDTGEYIVKFYMNKIDKYTIDNFTFPISLDAIFVIYFLGHLCNPTYNRYI
jgi:hypothetical protein